MHARRYVTQSVILSAALFGCLWTPAWAQQYRSDQVLKNASANRSVVLDSLNNPATYGTNKDGPFTEFFTKFYFPAMTQAEPGDLQKLESLRGELFKKYILATNNPDVQKYLTLLTYRAMANIVVNQPGQPPYNPSVRLNAVLI